MDHELSSSQLGEGQVGWDWTSIQFFDGRELMAYRMRRDDGSTDAFSTVAWIGQDGRVSQWGPDRFTWRGEGQWKSPRSGGTYPATVLLTVPEPDGRPGPPCASNPSAPTRNSLVASAACPTGKAPAASSTPKAKKWGVPSWR